MKENQIKIAYKVVGVFLGIYVLSMFIFPFFYGSFSWAYVHSVWYTWQSLNVGVLAFTSSIIAFSISRYKDEKQRERDFIASRAFLPQALSELCGYLNLTAKVLTESVNRLLKNDRKLRSNQRNTPELPPMYTDVFKDCIRHASPEVGQYLANILVLLQIHHSRTSDLSFTEHRANIKVYCYKQAELNMLVNHLFDFARGTSDFSNVEYSWDKFLSNYQVLGIDVDECPDLEGFTKRSIEQPRFQE